FSQGLGEFRDDARWQVDPMLQLRAGAEARDDARGVHVKFPAPPEEGQPPPSNFSNAPLVTYNKNVHVNVAGAYVAADYRPVPALTITPGLRFDHFFHLGQSTVCPRLQISDDVTKQWTARFAMGRYSRGLENAESADPNLYPEIAYQYVLGGEWRPRDGLSL